VVIEAAAMGVPAVATSVTGLVDAVVDGKTGLLVPAKNVGELGQALLRLIDQPDLRAEMGQAARNRAIKGIRRPFDQWAGRG
jgi:glycosyltransferase involved in cell wall biosynthesis